MRKKVDLTGKKVGLWNVIEKDTSSIRVPKWICECDCGTRRSVAHGNLMSGSSSCCGCIGRKKTTERNKANATHGMNAFPEIKQMWAAMHKRYEVSDKWSNNIDGAKRFIYWLKKRGWEKDNRYSLELVHKGKIGPLNCKLILRTPDLINRRFSRLLVISQAVSKGGKRWNCVCDCGNKTIAHTFSLIGGNTKSCGCLSSESTTKRNIENTYHGLRKDPIYAIWNGMLNRCKDVNNKYYGGKNIQVCEKWRSSVVPFFDWMLKNKWEPGLQVHRKNNKLGYSPENCILLSKSEHTILHNAMRREAG